VFAASLYLGGQYSRFSCEVSCPTMGVFICSDCNARDVGRSVFLLGDCSGVRLSGVVVSVVIRVGSREVWR
jgi:hypothetical protein